jgi:hypothetical protein
MKDDNFDLILAIPCKSVKTKQDRSKSFSLSPASKVLSYLGGLCDSPLKYRMKYNNGKIIKDKDGKEIVKDLIVKNAAGKEKINLLKGSVAFCRQIKKHGKYELVYNDESGNLKTERKPLLFGQVILYKDDINSRFNPECSYNFFAVISELSVKGESFSENNAVYIIYFVVPDINYHDLTLLMDQSHDLWCNIKGNIDSNTIFTDYLEDIGYKYLGKIYRIVFSDINQFKAITRDDNTKLFNILATEVIKEEDGYSHQIELSENSNEYVFSRQGNVEDITLIKKEKFFDDYNMYSSYRAYASIYSYYYIINEEDKDSFYKRMMPDENNENFSSGANILFVLETEIFKIGACLVASDKINQQININDMAEVQKMFKHFISMRPLFEKVNYRYLGAQKEADFIYKQFRIGDILADYDRKRELLKNYCEVTNSISLNKNSKILNCIGIIFTFIAGWDRLSAVSKILFDNENTVIWNEELIIPAVFSLIIIVIIIKIIVPVKYFKRLFKYFKRSLTSWFKRVP